MSKAKQTPFKALGVKKTKNHGRSLTYFTEKSYCDSHNINKNIYGKLEQCQKEHSAFMKN